jgi:hypothetical protein
MWGTTRLKRALANLEHGSLPASGILDDHVTLPLQGPLVGSSAHDCRDAIFVYCDRQFPPLAEKVYLPYLPTYAKILRSDDSSRTSLALLQIGDGKKDAR